MIPENNGLNNYPNFSPRPTNGEMNNQGSLRVENRSYNIRVIDRIMIRPANNTQPITMDALQRAISNTNEFMISGESQRLAFWGERDIEEAIHRENQGLANAIRRALPNENQHRDLLSQLGLDSQPSPQRTVEQIIAQALSSLQPAVLDVSQQSERQSQEAEQSTMNAEQGTNGLTHLRNEPLTNLNFGVTISPRVANNAEQGTNGLTHLRNESLTNLNFGVTISPRVANNAEQGTNGLTHLRNESLTNLNFGVTISPHVANTVVDRISGHSYIRNNSDAEMEQALNESFSASLEPVNESNSNNNSLISIKKLEASLNKSVSTSPLSIEAPLEEDPLSNENSPELEKKIPRSPLEIFLENYPLPSEDLPELEEVDSKTYFIMADFFKNLRTQHRISSFGKERAEQVGQFFVDKGLIREKDLPLYKEEFGLE